MAGQNDALDILKDQHREVESLFTQFESTENENEAFELAQVICQKLTLHATLEEEVFYPAVRSKGGELERVVLQSVEEHLSAKRLIEDIQGCDVGDERLEAKVTVLEEQIAHHVEEEEDEMFPQLNKAMAKEDRLTLGQRLRERTEQLEASENTEVEFEQGEVENEVPTGASSSNRSSSGGENRHSIRSGSQHPTTHHH